MDSTVNLSGSFPSLAGTEVPTVPPGSIEPSNGSPCRKSNTPFDEQGLTINVLTEPVPRAAYLDYCPMAPSHEGKALNYRTCLDRLGMKEDALDIRVQFVQEFKQHTQEPECTFLRKEDNGAAFDELIAGFLRKRGSYYWGTGNRDHLLEPDTSKGFLYPRDAERPNSRLMDMLEELFNYKARSARRNDSHRPVERQHIPQIDFATLVPSDINTSRRVSASLGNTQTGTTNTHSQEEYSGADDDDDSDIPLARRRRGLLDSMTDIHLTTPNTSDTIPIRQTRNSTGSSVDRKPLHSAKEPPTKPALGSVPKVNIGVLARQGLGRAPISSSSFKANVNQGRPDDVATTAELPVRELRNKRKRPQSIMKEPKATHSKTRLTRNSVKTPITLDESTHQEENTCMIIDEATFNNSPSVSARLPASEDCVSTVVKLDKDETDSRQVKIKTEALSDNITAGTTLMVTASCQQDMAPVTVKLSACKPLQDLFAFLAEECGLGPRTKNVVAISATYGWNKRQHRIRGYRFDTDLTTFSSALRDAWDSDPGVAKRGCEIAMLLHVED
ncbi:MAG: hypothetical protein Q9187_002979 [Circinaria calcarea]